MSSGERNGAARALPLPGQVIGGKYEIVRILGEGGMGVVFEAKHLKLHQRVAVKMLLPEMLKHDVIVTRFEREARASGQLRNRHTARVIDVDVTADGLPYMVMEFLEGHDLQGELDERGRIPLEEAVDYVLQACSAMSEAHQLGIVHRDLKPANLFLALDSNATDASAGRIVKVLDFGISKVQTEADVKLTVAETVIGTAMYMSPEQIRSSRTVDARTDIWSLGIILYELLAGRPPWIGSPTQLAAMIVSEDAPDIRTYMDVPPELAAIISKALTRDPQHRFHDVRQLAHELAPFAGSGRAGVPSSARFAKLNAAPPNVSVRPPELGDANTILQAPAISESRMGGGGAGTTPGWTQSGQATTRSRTLILGFFGAFAIGLAVVGAFAVFWARSQGSIDASSSPSSSASHSAAASPASAPPAAVAEPPPPAHEAPPQPSVSARAAPSSAPSASAAPPPRIVPHSPPAGSPAPHRPAPAPPVATAPTSNPIHL